MPTSVILSSPIKYSDVFSNILVDNKLKLGSWGSLRSKLLVLVERVGPKK